MPSRAVTGLVLVVVVGVGWGLLAPASKVLFASPGFDGLSLAVARAAWALPIYLLALSVTWRLDPPRLDAGRWAAVIAAGLIFGLLITTLFSVASAHTSVAHISFLVGMSPVTNTAAAAVVFRIALGRREWTALVLGIVGVALLALTHANDRAGIFGDALMVAWLACFAAYACALRYVGARVSTRLLMSMMGVVAMGSLLIAGALAGAGGAIAHVADSAPVAWWFFGEVVLGSMIVGQTAFAAAIRRMGVATATIGAEYTALAVGVIASLGAHERWTPLTVVAGAIFCCALAATFAPIPWLTATERRAA
ncbi:hypothetical protein WPS_34820 [Vulcanimicrobium alpinum]|uniref:EamA domain-containing protein n=1 Tax=Vulcanimicrobium alpinum TaxID=3016050 RepID=A0AAN1XZH0_UNVUL|nr:DMT family transporter [Vulcanimicrobium alpinum]BDE08206.1 hypothetical protein WPS_34820 [Vulcanimicrobium alpinum]